MQEGVYLKKYGTHIQCSSYEGVTGVIIPSHNKVVEGI